MEPDTPVARGTLEAVRRAVADARDRQFSIDEDGRRVREEPSSGSATSTDGARTTCSAASKT